MRNGLPTTAVHDLVIHPRENDLIVGTHGRGIFILDDITPLETLASSSTLPGAVLAAPRPASIQSSIPGPGGSGNRRYAGANPAPGAQISYFVGTGIPAGAQLSLVITDAAGEMVRSLPASADHGLHRVSWNLRMDSPTEGEAPGTGPAAVASPAVFPGPYGVQLRMAEGPGTSTVLSETTIEVRRDPFVRLSEAEYRELHRWRMLAHETIREAHQLAARLQAAREELAGAPAGVAEALASQLEELEVALRGPAPRGAAPPVLNRAAEVGRALNSAHFMPEPGHRQLLRSAENDLSELRQRAHEALGQASALLSGGR
jgi:hypothetical protein